jgi:hypothetical protein
MSKKYKRPPLIVGAAFLDESLEEPTLPVEMQLLWEQYLASGDTECLALAVEKASFFGSEKLGVAIAEKLRDKEPTDKLAREIRWREIDLLYEVLHPELGEKVYEYLSLVKGITAASMKRELMRRYTK